METRVELFARIRHDARIEGCSIRQLARRHQVGRATVRMALAQAEPPPRKVPVRCSPKLDPSKAVIDAMLTTDIEAPRKLSSHGPTDPRQAGRRAWSAAPLVFNGA